MVSRNQPLNKRVRRYCVTSASRLDNEKSIKKSRFVSRQFFSDLCFRWRSLVGRSQAATSLILLFSAHVFLLLFKRRQYETSISIIAKSGNRRSHCNSDQRKQHLRKRVEVHASRPVLLPGQRAFARRFEVVSKFQ